MTGTSQALTVSRGAVSGRIAECARHLERGKINTECACAVADRTDHVWPVKTFTGPGVISLEVIVQLKWLAVLQVQNTFETPAIPQPRQAPAHPRKFIAEIPGETAPDIKVRISALKCRNQAIVRLRSIGNEIFAVAGVVNGMRPDKIYAGAHTVPAVQTQAGLKCVI